MLNDLQRVVLAQLRRRNCHRVAGHAEDCWTSGQRSYLESRSRCPKWLRHLFFEANDQTVGALPKGAEPSASELFAWRASRRCSAKAYEWKIVAVRECSSPEELLPCDTPTQALAYWRHHIEAAPQFRTECGCFATLLLTTAKRIRGHHLVAIGRLKHGIVNPREALRAAVIGGASAVVLMHNHLGSKAEPSSGEVLTTKRIVEAGDLLKIDVLDRIIVGRDQHYSFREAGLL